jgi:hypothetical protein
MGMSYSSLLLLIRNITVMKKGGDIIMKGKRVKEEDMNTIIDMVMAVIWERQDGILLKDIIIVMKVRPAVYVLTHQNAR